MKQPCTRPLVRVNVCVNVVIDGEKQEATIGRAEAVPRVLGAGTITINIPGGTARVVTDSSGQCWICARGTLSAQAPAVYAKVYTGSGSAVHIDASPPPGTRSCSPGPAGSSGQFPWSFDRTTTLLPIATCVMSGSNPYTLAVWAMFDGDSAYTVQPQAFDAICATSTDCDSYGASGEPMMEARHPAVAGASSGGEALPHLVGHLRRKTGRFARLPETIELRWSCSQQGWTWDSERHGCGSFTVIPYRNWYLLHSTVTNLPLIPASAGGTPRPLHLSFRATTDPSAEAGSFTLDVSEGA